MASIDIIELRKTDTGERFYPLTHVDAVVGLSDRDFFEKYTDDNGQTYSIRLKQEYTGLWTEGFVSAGGLNANSGGRGGVTNLWALDDVKHGSTGVLRSDGVTPVQAGDILVYGVIDDTTNPDTYGWYAKPENSAGGGGTVTSVGLQAASGSGLSVSASSNTNPITGAGTFTIGIASGYKLPTTSEWSGKQDLIDSTHKLSYTLLSDTPTIPAAQVQTDWNATSGMGVLLNKPSSLPASDVYAWAKASTKPSYTFSELTSHPTTISGYGITDAKIVNGTITLGSNTITPLTSFTETDPTVPSWAKASTKPSYTFSELTAHPTTLSGYGITDAKFGTAGTDSIPITLGSTTKSVLTAHQSLSAYVTINSLKSKGSATLPVYFDSNGAAQTITGLVVSGNIQTTGGTLSVSGATTLGSTLSVADAITLSGSTNTTKRIYFDSTHYIELKNIAASGQTADWVFHFSHGLYSDSFVSGGGLNSGSGGGGGVENLWALHDVYSVNGAIVHADDSALANGDVLTYNSTKGKWVAAPTAAAGITGITMNGSAVSVDGSGVANLGTVITSHQDISGKADKVSSPTNGNFAALDSNGNLTDSGHKHSDYLTSHQSLGLVAGASGGTANATTTNGNTYINLLGGGVNKGGVKLIGASNVSVASNNAGQITITGPDLSGYQAKVSALGSNTEPVYISAAGTFSKAKKYAGGTAVTRNGVDKSAGTTSFYAPEGGGTNGYVLVAAGTSNAPTWRSEIFVDKTNSRVGIGTTSPVGKLHVVGNSIFNGIVDVDGSSLRVDSVSGRFLVDSEDDMELSAHGGAADLYLSAATTYVDGDICVNGVLYPMAASGGSLGDDAYSWGSIWANRWYPNPGDTNHYIEWDSSAGAFKIVGDVYATGQVAAGGIASNS